MWAWLVNSRSSLSSNCTPAKLTSTVAVQQDTKATVIIFFLLLFEQQRNVSSPLAAGLCGSRVRSSPHKQEAKGWTRLNELSHSAARHPPGLHMREHTLSLFLSLTFYCQQAWSQNQFILHRTRLEKWDKMKWGLKYCQASL